MIYVIYKFITFVTKIWDRIACHSKVGDYNIVEALIARLLCIPPKPYLYVLYLQPDDLLYKGKSAYPVRE